MDREEDEMQFLGLWGIYTESYKIIISCKKMFAQIALALILPLSFIFVLHIQVSELLLSRIISDMKLLTDGQLGSPPDSGIFDRYNHDLAVFPLFKAVYFIVLPVLSFLSTSAVIYITACIYTSGRVKGSFLEVVTTVIPRVWRRLMATFLCAFNAALMYSMVAAVLITILVIFAVLIMGKWFGVATFVLLMVVYVVGFVYMTVVWHLASVVSVLEDDYGVKAMVKSKDLIRGKVWLAIAALLMPYVGLFLIQWGFERCAVHGASRPVVTKTTVGYEVVFCLLLSILMLLGLVVQVVLYLVCKSYHSENIDRSALSDHLENYRGEYVPLTARDVQLEEFNTFAFLSLYEG